MKRTTIGCRITASGTALLNRMFLLMCAPQRRGKHERFGTSDNCCLRRRRSTLGPSAFAKAPRSAKTHYERGVIGTLAEMFACEACRGTFGATADRSSSPDRFSLGPGNIHWGI